MATNKNKTAEAAAETEKATEKVAEAAAPADDKVDLFVPKGYANDEPNQLISINGVNYLLPKGKTSRVPKYVAEEFHRAQRAAAALDERVESMLEAAK